MLIAHARQLGIPITHGFMTLNYGIHCGLTLSDEPGQVFAHNPDFFTDLVVFRLVFRMLGGSSFAFTFQPFSLDLEPVDRAFQLPGNLAQAFGYGCM
jgi:hypothetical protein